MKYSTVLLFAVGAFAIPQDNNKPDNAGTSALPEPSLTPAVKCVMACPAGDVNCQAACMGNARPNASQAIETNECAAKCDQGDGSTPAAQAYAKCVDNCINSLFPSSQTQFQGAPGAGAPAPTSGASPTRTGGSSAEPTGSEGSNDNNESDNDKDSEGASKTSSGKGPEKTGAADKASVHLMGAGLAGLFALFAL